MYLQSRRTPKATAQTLRRPLGSAGLLRRLKRGGSQRKGEKRKRSRGQPESAVSGLQLLMHGQQDARFGLHASYRCQYRPVAVG